MKKILNYLKKLISSNDPTSMTRFLEIIIGLDVLITWNIFCYLEKKIANIPDNVLYFAGLYVVGKGIKDIFFKSKGG